ncbi:hypothetical protein CC2G_003789 [Coprinopsis cinerea AmutBmut pab1-1]|nr:hypothetical protein CC2G_003789 [Coprinopsis cinerea AmutBmut pab1-1]
MAIVFHAALPTTPPSVFSRADSSVSNDIPNNPISGDQDTCNRPRATICAASRKALDIAADRTTENQSKFSKINHTRYVSDNTVSLAVSSVLTHVLRSPDSSPQGDCSRLSHPLTCGQPPTFSQPPTTSSRVSLSGALPPCPLSLLTLSSFQSPGVPHPAPQSLYPASLFDVWGCPVVLSLMLLIVAGRSLVMTMW